jgi:CRP/FNR family transcriptional regulator
MADQAVVSTVDSDSPRRRGRHKLPVGPVGPQIRAAPFAASPTGAVSQLLSDRQRQQLMSVASRLNLPARTRLYEAGNAATSIWIVAAGVVKSFRELPSGKRQVMGFLFAGDLMGLAENGKYVNTTQAVTSLTVYRIATEVLTDILRRDGELEFQFLCKVAHDLRGLQHRAIVVGRRRATARIAMFLEMLARHQSTALAPGATIRLPMSRTEVAEYLNLTPEAVSRALSELSRDGIAVSPDRHSIRIVDSDRLNRLIAGE